MSVTNVVHRWIKKLFTLKFNIGTPVDILNVTSQRLMTLTLIITIKIVLNVGPKTLTIIGEYNMPKKMADCGFRIRVRVSRVSRTLTIYDRICVLLWKFLPTSNHII